MSRLQVTWDKREVGVLEATPEHYADAYRFTYASAESPVISLSLPARAEPFEWYEARPFFEALLPEGTVRETIAQQLRIPQTDAFGLLAQLGRDCAGALQIVDSARMSDVPDVDWLTAEAFERLIAELPRRPLGMPPDGTMRLSLAGVQRKAVLVRSPEGRFGLPLNGMPSTHIVKPEPRDGEYPGIAVNELFCMRLASACGLTTAAVELAEVAGRPCLVIERYDRDLTSTPAARRHQEDLCQALGLIPAYKYAAPDRPRPSFADLGDVLRDHGATPGRDRIVVGRMAVFNYLIGNADAHGKNVSFLHEDAGRVRLAPLYDLVSTAAYPDLDLALAMAIGDEFAPDEVTAVSFDDMAADLGLTPAIFARDRRKLVATVLDRAERLAAGARRDRWHHPVIDAILRTIHDRAPHAS